jgi:hypothetical protein
MTELSEVEPLLAVTIEADAERRRLAEPRCRSAAAK